MAAKTAWELKQRRQRMVLAAQQARVVQRATQLAQAAAPEAADAQARKAKEVSQSGLRGCPPRSPGVFCILTVLTRRFYQAEPQLLPGGGGEPQQIGVRAGVVARMKPKGKIHRAGPEFAS